MVPGHKIFWLSVLDVGTASLMVIPIHFHVHIIDYNEFLIQIVGSPECQKKFRSYSFEF